MPTDPHRGTDRPAPSDTGAEAAVLGACLLSRQAVTDARTTLTPADWWRPRHAHIWHAITRVDDRGDPVDPITVAAELDNLGQLIPLDPDGPATPATTQAALLDLQAGAPGTTNAAHYARIVADHARRRRIIELGHHLAEAARTTSNPLDALTEARTRLDQAADTLVTTTNLRIPDLAEVIAGGANPVEPAILTRNDGRALLYAGCMHTFQAPPSTGKSWVALIAVLEVLTLGGSAVYLDWEDSPTSIVGRLLALGATPDAITNRFAYARVDGAYGPPERAEVDGLLARYNPDLVILDGVAEAMAHDGLDENAAPDFMAWSVRVPRPIAATGAAVVMLDHVRKDAEKGNRWARGSGAKLAAIDGAAYQLNVVDPYSRQRAGSVALVIAKDRHGGVGAIGETAAVIAITPTADGATVRTTTTPPPPTTGPDGDWRPPRIMVRVSALLEKRPMTAAAIADALRHSKREHVQAAIRALRTDGHITEVQGTGSVPLLRLVTPYVDPANTPPNTASATAEPLFGDDENHDDPPPDPIDLASWKEKNF